MDSFSQHIIFFTSAKLIDIEGGTNCYTIALVIPLSRVVALRKVKGKTVFRLARRFLAFLGVFWRFLAHRWRRAQREYS